ncbi:hypothetical protein AFLA_009647 [Aspergillus flavus NRRL3357]|nr:hypothetical protein AFLA_009647 [Aspergillus flavus NRRL3357]
MSALYKLAAVNNGPETSWDDNHMRLLTRLNDEEIEILQLPSPKCSAKRISAELCQMPMKKDQIMGSPWRLGICAMEDKALSKANQEIFRRLQVDGLIEVILFGDKTLLSHFVHKTPLAILL